MANLNSKITHRRESRSKNGNVGKRFYTALDMAIIKHDAAVINSQVKRGEITRHGNQYIAVCGCGVEGCFIHSSFESESIRRKREQDAYNEKWGITETKP